MRRISKTDALRLVEQDAPALARFSGCPMCALAAGSEATVLERDGVLVALDRFAARRGHLLVVLRRHVETLRELAWTEYLAVQRLAWEASRAVDAALKPRHVYVAALGTATARPMSFPHHHVHVVPLYDGDERDRPSEVFSWSRGVEIYEAGEAQALIGAVREAWPRGDP